MNKLTKATVLYSKISKLHKLEAYGISSWYSTKPAVKEAKSRDLREKIKETERISIMFRKPRIKKPQKPPFVKNLFLGKFDTDILTYPQLEKDELEALEANIKPVSDFFNDPEIRQTKTFSREFLANIGKLRVIGLKTPVTEGGRELTHTESCRFSEIIAGQELGQVLFANEQLGVQTLLKNGSDDLKRKYLGRLMSGELLCALCVLEEGNCDPNLMKTQALRNADGSWTLNGQKSWIINGSDADIFIVLAETAPINKDDVRESSMTAFVVEKKFGGITTQKHQTLLDADISDVHFSNTCVPPENVLGILDGGQLAVANIFTELRVSTGAACTTLIKQLINKFTEDCKNLTVANSSIIETDSVLTKTGELLATAYAMESTTYLTSLLLDQYENQDCDLEAAIVKVFSSEQTALASLQCLDFFGTQTLVENHWANKIHREALGYSMLLESNASLKLFIGLTGVQYTGATISEYIKKSRNPFIFPWEAIKKIWTNKRQLDDNPKMILNLYQHVHQSIHHAAVHLEYCVLRLQYATETLLIRHGVEVVNDHQNLRRLAECIIDIYAMTACIGRASRSYCIGLRHSEAEIIIATTFCTRARNRVWKNVNDILEGRYNTADQNKRMLAEMVAKWNGYFFEHPLARNF